MTELTVIHVAVAVVHDDQGRVLVARRPAGKHLAGYWEFPGGKVEPGEAVLDALARELREEVGIAPGRISPLIRLRHAYPDRQVLLDVHEVRRYQGNLQAHEEQELSWRCPADLYTRDMIPANLPIIHALNLPPLYAITPPQLQTAENFVVWAESLVARFPDRPLVQLRLPPVLRTKESLLAGILAAAQQLGLDVLLNEDVERARRLGFAGVHLPSTALAKHPERPVPAGLWLAASCHNAEELTLAAGLGVDFGVLSPVLPTPSHPHAAAIGWEKFARLADSALFPLYALGGLGTADVKLARQHGGQGVSGIRAFAIDA